MDPVVLWVEDNPQDVQLLQEACREARLPVHFIIVETAIAAFWYMEGRYGYEEAPRPPQLILLDLNLPAIRGRSVLQEVVGSRDYGRIPVVVLSSSCDLMELKTCIAMGAAECITKPTTFEGYAEVVRRLRRYLPGTSLPAAPANPGPGDGRGEADSSRYCLEI